MDDEDMANSASNNEVRQKIMNTIAQYKQRCQGLDDDISSLKSSIAKLCHVASGISDEVDEELIVLQDQAISGGSVDVIQRRINCVVDLLMSTGLSKSIHNVSLKDHLQQLFGTIENIDLTSLHLQQFEQLRQLVSSDQDDDIIIESLNALLSGVLTNMNETLQFNQRTMDNQKHSLWGKFKNDEAVVEPRVKHSMQELISHLLVPSNLEEKASEISRSLNCDLNYQQLGKIIDELSELVILSYNFEQSKLKSFLREFSTHLVKMESFLSESNDSDAQAYQQTEKLEKGIVENIKEVQASMEKATSIEQLVETVGTNINAINDSVVQYKQQAKERLEKSEQRADNLTERLQQAESETQKLKASVSYHESRANRDKLTGLPNREAYEKRFQEAYQRWKRSNSDLTIAICDIDHFKRVNDTFGHLAGDKVLKRVAISIKNSLREIDFVGRYGGEEFVLIFENTPRENVALVLEKTRAAIEDCEFHCQSERVIITMSFGYTLIGEQDNLNTAFHRADEALYKAKDAGRNKVMAG